MRKYGIYKSDFFFYENVDGKKIKNGRNDFDVKIN